MSLESDETYMNMALQQANIAAQIGEVPVGAVLICEDGQSFVSHNAPITLHDPSAHAEIRVIRLAAESIGNYRLINATLYVTLEPCTMCAGAIIHARIGRIVYGADDSKTGAVQSLYQILSDQRLNHQSEIVSGILAEECSAILKAFFKARRKNNRLQRTLEEHCK